MTPQLISKCCQLQSSSPDLGWDWARVISIIKKLPRVLGTWNSCHSDDGNTLQGRECGCVHVGWGTVKEGILTAADISRLEEFRGEQNQAVIRKGIGKPVGGKAGMETSERHKAPSSSGRLLPHQSWQALGAFWGS